MKTFVIGFPKAGSRTLQRAFSASGLQSAHWKVPEGFCGELIYRADSAGRDPLWHLLRYDCITQADVCMPSQHLNFWPNLDFALLGRIRSHHPECFFLLNYRDPAKVAASMRQWADMHARLVRSDIPGLPRNVGAQPGELEAWIDNHYAACRATFSSDPRFVEIDIEDPGAPKILEEALGLSLAWWGVQGAGPAATGHRMPRKINDLARAKRKARRIARLISHYALVPVGFARRSLRRLIER